MQNAEFLRALKIKRKHNSHIVGADLWSPVVVVAILENESESKKTDISRMVAQFKGCVTKELGEAIWQKGYFDHIIANEKDFNNCFDYIEANPYILEEKILEQRKKKMKQ